MTDGCWDRKVRDFPVVNNLGVLHRIGNRLVAATKDHTDIELIGVKSLLNEFTSLHHCVVKL